MLRDDVLLVSERETCASKIPSLSLPFRIIEESLFSNLEGESIEKWFLRARHRLFSWIFELTRFCLFAFQGEDIVKNIESKGSSSGTPKARVKIADSGEL